MERTTKDDGRYVLYYTWPEDGPTDEAAAADSAAAGDPTGPAEPSAEAAGSSPDVNGRRGAGPSTGSGGGRSDQERSADV